MGERLRHLERGLRPIWAGTIAIAVLAWLLPAKGASYIVYIAGLAGINVVLAASLNVVNGFTGQFSLGHAGFMAVGGYTAATITVFIGGAYKIAGLPAGLSDGILFFVGTVLGGVVAALAG